MTNANVNEMFDDIKSESSSFKKKKFIPIVEGEYFCKIAKVETNIRDVKKDGNFKARVYNYTVEVMPENKQNLYDYEDEKDDGKKCTTDGDHYVGYNFRGSVWRFLEPQKEYTFQANNAGNKGYISFCEALGVECPKETKQINGKDVEIHLLPNLTSDDIIGKPVISVVKKGRKWKNNDGFWKQFYDSKFVRKWDRPEGELNNDLPL